MNNTRKCFLILTIVFLLVGLGTLAASDVTTNDTGVSKTTETSNTKIVNKDTNTVSKSLKTEDIVTDTINDKNKNIKKNNLQKIRKTSEEIHVENYGNLTDALDKDAESVNIFIENDITLEDYLQVSDTIKNLSIDGKGFTINGQGKQFLFITNTCNITLTNLNIKNCSGRYGGVIISKGNLTIENCNLTNNYVVRFGGVLHHYGNLTISNSNISSNTAGNGGAISYHNIESYDWMKITGSTFFNNTSDDPELERLGGAIFIEKNTDFDYAPSVIISDTKFIANNADYGGAIYSEGGNISIKDSEFKQNNATDGGAISYYGDLLINNTNMTDNNATYGGAIDYRGNLTIINTHMTNNTAEYYGGAIRNILDYEESILNITDSEFINNRVTDDFPSDAMGGAIYIGPEEFAPGLNNSAFITNTKFIKNNALIGGAIFIYGENLYIKDSTLESNSAQGGGAILAYANLTVTNTNMTDNDASLGGGAITFYYADESTNLNIYDSTFTRNRAEDSSESGPSLGGAIFIHHSQDEEEVIIVGDNPVINMKNSRFTENYADIGGAIYINGTNNIILQNTNMTQNSAKQSGILYASENSNITIEGGTIKGNHANNTLLSINITDTLKISNSNFIDNYVTDNTGYVVDLQNINNIKIVDTKFDNNTDNKRDMLFSDAKEDASVDIHGNNYTNNYLSVNLTQLDNFDAKGLSNETLTFPVNITTRKIYNHTIKTGNIFFKTDLIDDSNPVTNGQSTITLDNKKLQNNTNKVNYNYTSIQKHYQTANNTFNILKEMKESKINEIIIDPTRDSTEIIIKVSEDGQEIEDAPIKITLPDGKTIETTSNKKIELDLPVGENKITIEYPGDITTKPETKTVTITVTPTPTTSTINIENPTAGNVKVTGTVKDKNGKNVNEGTVTIKDNDKVIGTANIKNGVYTTTVNLNKGSHTIYVEYNPTKNYTTSSNGTQVNIKARNPVIKLDPVRGIIGENITLTAYLTDENSTPINGGNLAFKLNGKTLRTDGRFDSNATAMKFKVRNGIVTYTIKADLYMRNAKNLTASYSGNSMYQEITSPTVEAQIQRRTAQITVQATPNKVKQYETVTITATLKDTTKNTKDTTLIHQNSKVMLKLNDKTLKDANNNTLYVNVGQDNKAVYNYTIPAGTGGIKNGTLIDYKTEAILVNDNYYPSVRNSTKFNIEQSNTTLAIKEAKVDKNNLLSLQATLTDYKGNNLVGTNKISIKINGITLKNETGGARTWNATNGVINLSGIQVDKNTTIKRVMIVSSERQAYSEARNETTNIIRV